MSQPRARVDFFDCHDLHWLLRVGFSFGNAYGRTFDCRVKVLNGNAFGRSFVFGNACGRTFNFRVRVLNGNAFGRFFVFVSGGGSVAARPSGLRIAPSVPPQV